MWWFWRWVGSVLENSCENHWCQSNYMYTTKSSCARESSDSMAAEMRGSHVVAQQERRKLAALLSVKGLGRERGEKEMADLISRIWCQSSTAKAAAAAPQK